MSLLASALAADLPAILADAGDAAIWRRRGAEDRDCQVVIDEQDGTLAEIPGGLAQERVASITVPLATIPDPQIDDLAVIAEGAHAGAWRVTGYQGRSQAHVIVRALWRHLEASGDAAALRRRGGR